MRDVIAENVPCASCTTCCQNDATFLHPELGDDTGIYQTEQHGQRLMLAHKKNGDCLYLDRATGCTIYAHRPAICRKLDCRNLLTIPRLKRKAMLKQRIIGKKLIQAARDCKKRGDTMEKEQSRPVNEPISSSI